MNRISLKGPSIAILAMVSAIACAQSGQVTVDGNPINFADTQPQMVGGRLLVPMRGVFEAIGATVIWDADSQTVTASTDSRRVSLRIGDKEANVDGKIVEMDQPAEIVGDSTLVPLRFLSQSLGASVDWEPKENLVAVMTRGYRDGRAQHIDSRPVEPTPVVPPVAPPVVVQPPVVVPPPVVTPPPPTIIVVPAPVDPPRPREPERRIVFSSYAVIPLRLDQTLTSNGNQEGDTFTATVRSDQDGYLELPKGTLVTGVIRRARAAVDGKPGLLDVRFTDLLLPDGAKYPISGTVAALDDPNIIKGGGGRLVAKNSDDVKGNIEQDAAIGAGAGLVIGSLHGRAIGGAAAGGVLGAIVGALTPRHHHDRNVKVEKGTKLGLILSRDVSIARHDLG